MLRNDVNPPNIPCICWPSCSEVKPLFCRSPWDETISFINSSALFGESKSIHLSPSTSSSLVMGKSASVRLDFVTARNNPRATSCAIFPGCDNGHNPPRVNSGRYTGHLRNSPMQRLSSLLPLGPSCHACKIHSPPPIPTSLLRRDQCKQTRCSLSPNVSTSPLPLVAPAPEVEDARPSRCSKPLVSRMPPSNAWRNRSVNASFLSLRRIRFSSTLRYSLGMENGGGISPSPVSNTAYVVRESVTTVVTSRSNATFGAFSLLFTPILMFSCNLVSDFCCCPSWRQKA